MEPVGEPVLAGGSAFLFSLTSPEAVSVEALDSAIDADSGACARELLPVSIRHWYSFISNNPSFSQPRLVGDYVGGYVGDYAGELKLLMDEWEEGGNWRRYNHRYTQNWK